VRRGEGIYLDLRDYVRYPLCVLRETKSKGPLNFGRGYSVKYYSSLSPGNGESRVFQLSMESQLLGYLLKGSRKVWGGLGEGESGEGAFLKNMGSCAPAGQDQEAGYSESSTH